MNRGGTLLALCAAGVIAVGCFSSDDAGDGSGGDGSPDALENGTVEQKRAAADTTFRSELDEISQIYTDCKDLGAACTTGPAAPLSVRAGELRPMGLFDGIHICDTLGNFRKVLKGATHPYYFWGLSGIAGVGAVDQVGIDYVWDIWNKQAAAFHYTGGGIATIIGVEGSGYAGYGFGAKAGVIDAWSGVFVGDSASVGLPFALASVGGSIFRAEDSSLFGGAINVSLGLDVKPTPYDFSITTADWTEWDQQTEAMLEHMFFVNATMQKTSDGKGDREYIQFATTKGMALAEMWLGGPGNALLPIPATIAVGVLKRTGLTIDDLCPEPDAGDDGGSSSTDGGTDTGVDGGGTTCPPDAGGLMFCGASSCSTHDYVCDGTGQCQINCCFESETDCKAPNPVANSKVVVDSSETLTCGCKDGFKAVFDDCEPKLLRCDPI